MAEELTEGQNEFLHNLNSGVSIFLTGKAGTGKSFIVKKAFEVLKDAKIKYIAVAPTGIAANNIDGQTIHSLFQIPPFGVVGFDQCNKLSPAKKEVLKAAQVIFVDEVSMLRPDVLDAMHLTLRKNNLPGLDRKQLVFIGDMKQLPCILDDNTRSVLYETYNGDTFKDAHILRKVSLRTVDLEKVVRQSNPEFIEALNKIRDGGKSEYFRQFVSTEARGVILAPHNSTVLKYNQIGLNNQQGEAYTFKAQVEGTAKPEDFNMEREVIVKNGCKIMYLVNSKDNPLRNGTIGIFVSHAGCHYIRVGNVDYALKEEKQTKKQYVYNREKDALELNEIGSITQMPIKLAYALSIHKSQGLTFDEVTIDLTLPVFQQGQMYVALSRVKTPEGLRIIIK